MTGLSLTGLCAAYKATLRSLGPLVEIVCLGREFFGISFDVAASPKEMIMISDESVPVFWLPERPCGFVALVDFAG